MADQASRSLTVPFGYEVDPTDPKEKRCPDGFTGYVPPTNTGGGGGNTINPGTPPDTRKFSITFESKAAGKLAGTWGSDDQALPNAALTISFSAKQTECPPWANILCWKPIPLDYIGFYVRNVYYAGDYDQESALPAVNGTYDAVENKIELAEIEVPGDEGPTKVKPSIRIMWPPGDLTRYINLEHYLNPWFEIETRVRTKMPKDEKLPPMWIQGPFIGGDQKGQAGSPTIYALRVPVAFTWAEGEVPPDVPTGAVGLETYQAFLTAEDAFKPQGDGRIVQVADPPKDGEEYSGPGVDLTEEGLNEWLTKRGENADPLTAGAYTLLMEIRPAWGRFTVKGKYLCGTEVRDLSGEYGFYREPSTMLNYPIYKVPVAYLRLADWWEYFCEGIWSWHLGGMVKDLYYSKQELVTQPDRYLWSLANGDTKPRVTTDTLPACYLTADGYTNSEAYYYTDNSYLNKPLIFTKPTRVSCMVTGDFPQSFNWGYKFHLEVWVNYPALQTGYRMFDYVIENENVTQLQENVDLQPGEYFFYISLTHSQNWTSAPARAPMTFEFAFTLSAPEEAEE